VTIVLCNRVALFYLIFSAYRIYSTISYS